MKSPEGHALRIPAFPSDAAAYRSTAPDRWALYRIQSALRNAPVRVRLWDGYEVPSAHTLPVTTIVVKNRRALFAWLWDPELNFGEAYMSGAIEVRGDLTSMLDGVYREWTSSGPRWWRQRANNLTSARANVHHHYDLGNDFYRLWLDRDMVYTCAYFPVPDATLEVAQIAKMDRVARKLRLQPGERVIEAGCGWGSLALFMAREYGVRVRAFNISTEQIAYAQQRARDEGLTGQVEFIEDDYRNVEGAADVFVSVGMLEHVGLPDYPSLGRVIDRVLTPSGRGLLHFIGRNQPAPLNPWIAKRIFPGGYPPTLREVFERVLEPHSLSVLDVENLRLHYARTLKHWRMRFEDSAGVITEMFDETFVRAWRLYLAGSEASFLAGSMQLFQVVFARGSTNEIPWNRES